MLVFMFAFSPQIPVGDQPPNIEQLTRNLIFEYASNPSALLLAVVPANMDIVNSEALKFVSEVDPHGMRTLGVLTKLDLMDAGTNASEVLSNKGPLQLRLGFVGVVCRSQKSIIDGKPIDRALQEEELFLKNHPIYKNYRCGSVVLGKTLHNLLLQHIKDRIPFLKSKVSQLMATAQDQLHLGQVFSHTSTSKVEQQHV